MSDRNVSLLGRRKVVEREKRTIEPWPRPDRERKPPDCDVRSMQEYRDIGGRSTMLPNQNGRFQAPNVWSNKNDDSFDGKKIDDDDSKRLSVMMVVHGEKKE